MEKQNRYIADSLDELEEQLEKDGYTVVGWYRNFIYLERNNKEYEAEYTLYSDYKYELLHNNIKFIRYV